MEVSFSLFLLKFSVVTFRYRPLWKVNDTLLLTVGYLQMGRFDIKTLIPLLFLSKVCLF